MQRVVLAITVAEPQPLHEWLETNLTAFSRAHARGGIEEKWFKVVALQGNGVLDTLWGALTNPEQLKPADETERNVIFLGSATDPATQALFATAAQALRRYHFQQRLSWTLRIAGVLLWPSDVPLESGPGLKNLLAQVLTQKDEEVVALRTWDFLAIVRDSNQRHDFPNGYPRLQDPMGLLAICGLHLALHVRRLEWPRPPDPQRGCLWTMGAAGLFFDETAFRNNYAQELADVSLKRSKETEQSTGGPPPWDASLENLAHLCNGQVIAEEMLGAPERPKLFFPGPFGAKHRASYSPISPWRFWSSKLLTIYFGIYLKTLPTRLREFCHLYLLRLKEELRRFVDPWTRGRLSRFQNQLEETLERLLATYGSLGAVGAFLEDLQERLEREQRQGFSVATGDWVDTEAWLKNHLPAEPRQLSSSEEGRLLTKLAEVIGRHPLPGTLFLLGYLGALALFLIFPWPIGQRLGAASLLFGAAIGWYWLILRERMKAIRTYLAAVVSHAQWQLAEAVRKAVVNFQQDTARTVREIRDRLAALAYSPRPVAPAAFRANELFQLLNGEIRVPGRREAIAIKVRVGIRTQEGVVPVDMAGGGEADRLVAKELAAWLVQDPTPRQHLRAYLLSGNESVLTDFYQELAAYWEKKVALIPDMDNWLATALALGQDTQPPLTELLAACASRAWTGSYQPANVHWHAKGPLDQATQRNLEQKLVASQGTFQGTHIPGSPIFTLANFAPLPEGEVWPRGVTLRPEELQEPTLKVAGWTRVAAKGVAGPAVFGGIADEGPLWLQPTGEAVERARRERDAVDKPTADASRRGEPETPSPKVEF